VKERALDAWGAVRTMIRPGTKLRRPRLVDGPWPGAGRAAVWPLSQVLAAAVDLVRAGWIEAAEVHELLTILDTYRDGDGFGPFPGERPRYYDDNAWLALDLLDAADVLGAAGLADRAARTFRFIREGEHPDGGVYWVESPRRSRHTCSTAPAGLVAVGLAERAADRDGRDDLLAFAGRCDAYLTRALRRDDALYADKVDDDGTRDEAIYAYNQGTPVALAVARFDTTGDRSHLDDAEASAAASLAYFGVDDRLWRHEPCFNAIWLRNLRALGDPAVEAVTAAYADRLWDEGRDPRTGWFTGGGIGRYDRGGVLDQAGVVQVLTMAATGPA